MARSTKVNIPAPSNPSLAGADKKVAKAAPSLKKVKELYPEPKVGKVIETTDENVDLLLQRHLDLKQKVSTVTAELEAVEAEIRAFIKDAEFLRAPSFNVSCSLKGGSDGTVVTEDMVGTVINARRASRQLIIDLAG